MPQQDPFLVGAISVFQFIRSVLSGEAFYPIVDFFKEFYVLYSNVALTFSLILIVVFINLVVKLNAIRKKETEQLYPEPVEVKTMPNAKWRKVIEHINSENSSDWRLAIIEADIILDEMLDALGYEGESIGEKLKSVKRDDFATLNNAWEAHKVRNNIAHEGAGYELSHREAKRTIDLFRTVFEEFKYI